MCLALLAVFTSACATRAVQETKITPPVDPAKATASDDGKLIWYNALELGVEGQGWKDLKHPYDRLPSEAEGVVRDAVWWLSHDSAGLSVRFTTDSPVVAARWSLRKDSLDMFHMPSTGVSGLDLYAKHNGDWRWVAMGRPEKQNGNEKTLVSLAPAGVHEYLLYLPLYNGIGSLEIGIKPDATLHKAPAYQESRAKPVLFWGTSILQGGCASRPGMAYPSIIGRRLQRDVINLGFSGNGKMDPELVQMIAKLDVSAYVIDCGPNMTPPLIAERTEPLVKTLRAAHPQTPIVLVENIHYQDGWFIESKRASYVNKNAELKAAYDRLRSQGIRGLYYIPCDDLFGNDSEATVDGVHATDLGFMRMADVIEPVLRRILK
jgi:GDSL-like Lipase/Acylhydrolase family/N-terminus of Esterase_SGNH_hydro-type